jgi:hypothetical protein
VAVVVADASKRAVKGKVPEILVLLTGMWELVRWVPVPNISNYYAIPKTSNLLVLIVGQVLALL